MLLYMMGVLGMAQAILLPGLCVTACFRDWNWIQRAIFAVPISVFLNHQLVFLLVSLGAYSRPLMLAVLSIEAIWLFYAIRRFRAAKVHYEPLDKIFDLFFLTLCTAAIIKYVQAWARQFSDVFQIWDAIVSWNKWAIDWYEGNIPVSGLYPDGMPALFSIPYALMGRTDIESFSKAISGLIFLAALFSLLELGFRKREDRALAWGLAYVFQAIQARYLQSHWNSGYADVPLACFLVFTYSMSKFSDRPWLVGITAGTASLMKQPGLMFAGVVPFLCWPLRELSVRRLLGYVIPAALAVSSWYGFVVLRIYGYRHDSDNLRYLTTLNGGGLWDRWSFAWQLLHGYAGSTAYLVGLAIAAVAGIVVSTEARRWLLWLGIPYLLIWMTAFSYDIRNISMSLFPISMGVTAALVFTAYRLEVRLPRLAIFRASLFSRPGLLFQGICLCAALAGLASLSRPISHWKKHGGLRSWEHEQKLDYGDFPKANRALLEYVRQNPNSKVVSNYQWLAQVPGFQQVPIQSCEEALGEMGLADVALIQVELCPPGALKKFEQFKKLYYDGRAALISRESSRTISDDAGRIRRSGR